MHATKSPHHARLTPRPARAHAHPPMHSAPVPRAHAAHPARGAKMPRLWHFAVEYLLLLPIGAAIALLWAPVSKTSDGSAFT